MGIKIDKLLFKLGRHHSKQSHKEFCRIILSRDFLNQELRSLPEIFSFIEINKQALMNAAKNNLDNEALVLLDKIEEKIIERIQKTYNSINEKKSFQTENLSEHILELILKSLNSDIKYIFESHEYFNSLLPDINIFLGILEISSLKDENKYNFHFSYLNKTENFLVYKQGNKYQLLDIIKSSARQEENNSNSNKIFSNITSGQIDSPSFLIICNRNLRDYIVPDKLKQLVISLDINTAFKYLKRLLIEANIEEETNFAAIFVYLTTEEEKKAVKPENSLEKLIITGKNTEKFLEPSIIPDLPKNISKLNANAKDLIKKLYLNILKFRNKIFRLNRSKAKIIKQESIEKAQELTQKMENIKKDENVEIVKVGETEISNDKQEIVTNEEEEKKKGNEIINEKKNFSLLTVLKGIKISYIFFPIKFILKIGEKIILGILTLLWLPFQKISKISKTKKILAIVIIIIGFSVFYGILNIRKGKIVQHDQASYSGAFQEVKTKINLLEAALIYNNNEKAEEILKEVENIIKTKLPEEKILEQDKANYSEIKKSLAKFQQKINKFIIFNNAKKLLPNLDENPKIQDIILLGDSLALFDFKNNLVYKFDINKNSTEKIKITDDEKVKFSELSSPAKYGDNGEIILYSKNKNKLFKITLGKKQVSEINKNLFNGEIKGIRYYSGSLYVLDTKNNQIYKFSGSTGKKWINDSNIDLKEAVDFIIDSNIFVLKNNGEVLKFYKGSKADLKLKDISPELKNPLKIYTEPDYKYLYILEAANKRILVFEKKCEAQDENLCKLIAQYTSPQFDDLNDFTVDEKKKTIYLLNKNEIYKIEISE